MRPALRHGITVGIAIVLALMTAEGFRMMSLPLQERAPRSAQTTMATVRIPAASYEARVEVARTSEERVRGLSGRDGLAPGTGMLFVFDTLDQHRIWMRGMQFSIDLIWVAGGVVVDTHERLSVPPPGADARTLPYLNPRPQALLVVEVPAGVIAEHRIIPGQRVEVQFDSE